ncbi:hypothetical protein FACUT_5556 [Fusarium acutatum]|uniref:Ankyrin n=1 Tax=Fusarium acutatum TaxID=78861 RepID=A0A8H4NH35_9HYPO|nr:hypothetical protein FACUT_5556 [Fusarium acutatum]
MADPLSLAASIAGLISLADVIFRTTYKFIRAAKDAKDEIQSLLDEINNLSSVLRYLEALTADLENEGQSSDPTLRNHYLNHCHRTFIKIESRVKKASESFKKSRFDGVVRQLKWPFSSSEMKELLSELSRHKETISVALLADSMRKIQLSLSKSDDIDKKITALGDVARRIEINTTIAVNKRKRRILNHFMKANPQPALQTSIKLRYSMTGLWLTESPTFIRWLETPGSKLWLTGIPGGGKTILAGSVIQEALSRKTWKIVNIFGALASQLARQSDECYNGLNTYYERLNPPRALPQTADALELRDLIGKMYEKFDQTIIVVDGVDECDDLTDEVVDSLIQLADDSERVSMAIFSRDHVKIRMRLEEDFEPIQIAAHREDVELYVNAEVDKRIRTRQLQLGSVDMKEEIRSALVSKADGMFRWVVCQLDYLCNCAHDQERREALSKLPPDLPESYRRLLEKLNDCSIGVQNMVQMCLHFMAVAEPKLTIVELQQAVLTLPVGGKLDKGNTLSEYEILNRCSNLIRKSTDGKYFEFAHFSVREFLEGENAICQNTGIEKYWIAQHTKSSLLTTQCLRFLQMENFDKWPSEEVAATRQRDDTYPFYRHAALLWTKLTKDGLSDGHILDLAKSLFQPSKRAYFMCWAIEILKKITYATGTRSALSEKQARRIVINPSFQPLHMAATLNLPEICGFLIYNASDVNQKLDTATPLDLAFMSILAVPGLPETSGKNELHRDLLTNGRNQFLPSSQRRNMTIDCLINAGARSSDPLIPPNTLSVFSITCVLASIFNDLYPVLRCLSSPIIPSVSDVKVLQEWLMPTSTSNYVAEVSTHMLLKFLSSTGAYNNDWGAEMGIVVWSWAQECGFSLTRDLSLVGSCDLMSDDALVSQLVSAICSDNTKLLKYCFKDRRLKNQVRYSGLVDGLLHLAIKYNAFDNFKALVIAGFDPYTQNEEGKFPIHLCERHGRLRLCKVLKDLGISLMSQDNEGYNILHYWAQDRPLDYQFINDMFELNTEEAINGLQPRSRYGDTPLIVVFESAGESPRSEHRNIDLNKLCLQILGFLQGYRRAKGMATSLGTEQSVYSLKEAFTEFDDGLQSSDEISVLFQDVIQNANLDMIRLLNENGADLHHRVDDQTPFEVAFRARVAIDLCNTEHGATALRELLERCSVEETVKNSLGIDDASPLHTLAISEDAKNILWLADALVQYGFDINYVGSDSCRPISTDKLEFLQKIANHTKEAGTWFRSSDPVTFEVQNFGQKTMISNGTALHMASACNSVACLEYMLNHVSEPDKTLISDEGLSPVHIAAYGGFVDIVKLLLTKGFDAMAESQFGFSPLHMAVFGGHLRVVQCLIEHGAFQTLDKSGMSPGRISFELGFEEIYEALEGDYKQISSIQELAEFVDPTQRLAMAFGRAMDQDDYESMRRLLRTGCPVDVPLPSRHGLSALLIALDDGNSAMGEWLLGVGASALQADCNDGSGKSVIELAAGLRSLNRLLPELFLKYLRQGGDLMFGYFTCEDSWKTWTYRAKTTALHIAAWDGNKEAVSLLVDRGADIDAVDSNGWTPLMFSQDASTAQHLLSLGASTAAVCRVGSLASFINWFGDNLFDEAHPVSFSRLPKEFFTVSDPPRFSTKCEALQLTPETLNSLNKLKPDLVSEDEAGRSMMHYILSEEDLVDWVLDCEQDLSRMTPFPWHLEWCEFSGLALLTSSFERLRQRMPADLFCKVLNLEPPRGWSPLCHAAALNRVDIVANCLAMGADNNFEGSCFGSALMNASVCGSLDAVKLLVRNGASLKYMSKNGFRSCFLVAGTEAVKEWLLCGQFMDQKRLAAEDDANCVQEEVPWGGYIEAKVLLYGRRARWREESTLDYAKRLSKMKKSWQGKVVRLHVEETEPTSGIDSDTGSEEAESDPIGSSLTRISRVRASDSVSESDSESGSG